MAISLTLLFLKSKLRKTVIAECVNSLLTNDIIHFSRSNNCYCRYVGIAGKLLKVTIFLDAFVVVDRSCLIEQSYEASERCQPQQITLYGHRCMSKIFGIIIPVTSGAFSPVMVSVVRLPTVLGTSLVSAVFLSANEVT